MLLEQKGTVAANMRPTVCSVCVLLEQKGTVAANMRPVKRLTSLPPVCIHSCFLFVLFALFVVVVAVV